MGLASAAELLRNEAMKRVARRRVAALFVLGVTAATAGRGSHYHGNSVL